jgi:hypothetical protein
MSHKATVETKITNLEVLKKAIKALGLSYYEGQELSGRYTGSWSSEDKRAELIISIEDRKDIGFRKDDKGFYNLVGDFFGLRIGQKGLKDQVLQMYNVEYVKDVIENTSTAIGSYVTVVMPNGDIVLEGDIDEEQIVSA